MWKDLSKYPKVLKLLIAFLLMIPFRLPMSIWLVNALNWVSTAGVNGDVPTSVLWRNLIVTKLVYNLFIGFMFCYNIEKLSLDILKKGYDEHDLRRRKERGEIYWWTVLFIVATVVYIGFDLYATGEIFDFVQGGEMHQCYDTNGHETVTMLKDSTYVTVPN